MKKTIRTIVLSAVCCFAAILSGCDSEEGLKFAPIKEVRENFTQSVEELKACEFENLNFSKASFSFPEIDSISKLSIDVLSGKSAQEIYDFMCESIDSFMPGKYTAEQKMKDMKFYDGTRDKDGNFPTMKDYVPTDNPYPSFEAEGCFMDLQNGVLRWFDNADLLHWIGEEGKPIMMGLAAGNRHEIAFTEDMNSTDEYELIDGKMSIKEAAEFVDNYLQTTTFSPYELSARKKAVAVNVVNIGNGKYGYNFIITPVYKNVLFDYPDVSGVAGTALLVNDYDKRDYNILPGQADMINTDKVYHFILPAYNRSLKEIETYDSIITLESAAKTVSNFYSDEMNFYVMKVQAVYLPCEENVEPCWKFLMNGGGMMYNTFVNMHTGEIHVYIQA